MTDPFQFHHPAGVQISPEATELAMESVTYAHPNHEPEDYRNGWTWYSLPPVMDGTQEIGFRLGFENGVLREVEVFDSDPNLGTNWNEWSREKEEARAMNAAHWLMGLGFALGDHDWGTIWCGYDDRSGCGMAVVRYGL